MEKVEWEERVEGLFIALSQGVTLAPTPVTLAPKNLPTWAILAPKRSVREWHIGKHRFSYSLSSMRALRSFVLVVTYRYR